MPFRTCLTFAALLSLTPVASAQTTYTWNGGNGNWSTVGNWSPSGTPGASDTANITPTTGNLFVTYDAAALGSLGTLNLNSANGLQNTLDVQRNLTITNAVTLGGIGQVFLRVSPQSGVNPNLTVTGGLTVGPNGTLWLNTFDNGGGVYGSTTVTGNVTINGGTAIYFAPAGTVSGVATHVVDGNYAMSSGQITLQGSTISSNQMLVTGNFTATGGTIAQGAGSAFFFRGTTNSVSGVTFQNEGGGAPTLGTIYLSRNGFQSLVANSPLPTVIARSGLTTFNSKRIGHATAGSTLDVYRLQATTSIALGFGVFELTSNVRTTSGASNMLSVGPSMPTTGAKAQLGVVLNGFTLDISANSQPWVAQNGGSAAAGVRWLFDATPGGTLRAAGFNLSAPKSGVGILGYTTLQATGGNGTVLNLTTNPTATEPNFFDTRSRILYTGNATLAGAASLTADQTLGQVEVGGALAGALRVDSSLTLAGGLRINPTGSVTLIGTSVVTINSAGDLSGAGLLRGTGSASQVVFAAGATGGIAPGASGAGNVGTLTVSNTSFAPQAVSLASTSVSRFDIASASSFDRLDLTNRGIRYDGTLNLNFIYTPGTADPTSFTLFANPGAVVGDFTALTSNLDSSAFTLSFNPGTGILTITPVPEPGLVLAVAAGVLAVGGLVRRKWRGCGLTLAAPV